MTNAVLGAFAYALTGAAPSLAMSLVLYAGGSASHNALDDLFVAAYVAGHTALFRLAGYLVPTAVSSAWRRLSLSRALIISAALGLITPVVSTLVLALTAGAVLPLFHSQPWVAVALTTVPPGILLGFVAVWLGTRSRRH
jgi:hypothetical protein